MNTFLPRRLVAATLLIFTAGLAQADPAAVLDRDMRVFLDWLPGRYDNQEQVYFERLQERPEHELHERIHVVIEPVPLAAFGDHVFFVQQMRDDDPSNTRGQLLYVISADNDANAIRMRIYRPADPTAIRDAHADQSLLDDLTPENTEVVDGCDVLWRREAGQFAGSVVEGACRLESSRTGKTVTLNNRMLLSETALWVSDQATDENGNLVSGNKAGIPYKTLKARRFECWAGMVKADGEMDFWAGIEVWDQGSKAWLETDEPEPQKLGLQIRNVRWPTGNNRDSMVLYAWRNDEERAVSYAWSSPESERLAMNLRWMQTSCTLTPKATTSPIAPD